VTRKLFLIFRTPFGCSFRQMPPSRQERRKAERDAAKAPAKSGAGGAAGAAAAARTNVNVNPVGDWTTQTEDPNVMFRALGSPGVQQMAAAGDGAAQYRLGYMLVSEAGVEGTPLGAAGRSPQADVGWNIAPTRFRSLTRPRCVEVVTF